MFKFIKILLLILLCELFSCNDNFINNNTSITELNGSWEIVNKFLTNGPVCYDNQVGDTVIIKQNNDSIKFEYFVFAVKRLDKFRIDTVLDNYILANGLFNEFFLDKKNKLYYPVQILKLEKNDKYIVVRISIETYKYGTDSLIEGDIVHFKARKLK